MMYTEIRRKIFPAPEINRAEILRYAGCREEDENVTALMEECLGIIEGKLTYAVCSRGFSAEIKDDICDLGFVKLESRYLSRLMKDCDEVVVFAATLGVELDRLIARFGKLSPSKGLMLQAIGAERIESLCDSFCEEVEAAAASEGRSVTSRFSPGYGDVPLEIQRDIFRVTDCTRQIGLTLNDSMLMSPSKSVTAIIGAGRCAGKDQGEKCERCGNTDCVYRRI